MYPYRKGGGGGGKKVEGGGGESGMGVHAFYQGSMTYEIFRQKSSFAPILLGNWGVFPN